LIAVTGPLRTQAAGRFAEVSDKSVGSQQIDLRPRARLGLPDTTDDML